VKTSYDLIQEAIKEGHAVVALADGDVHVCDLSQHQLPDVICSALGCTKAYDSRLKLPHLERWKNSGTARVIKNRDFWRYGLCPDHC